MLRKAVYTWRPLDGASQQVNLNEIAVDSWEVCSFDGVVLGYVYYSGRGWAKWQYRYASDLALERRGSNLETLELAVSQLLYALRERSASCEQS